MTVTRMVHVGVPESASSQLSSILKVLVSFKTEAQVLAVVTVTFEACFALFTLPKCRQSQTKTPDMLCFFFFFFWGVLLTRVPGNLQHSSFQTTHTVRPLRDSLRDSPERGHSSDAQRDPL